MALKYKPGDKVKIISADEYKFLQDGNEGFISVLDDKGISLLFNLEMSKLCGKEVTIGRIYKVSKFLPSGDGVITLRYSIKEDNSRWAWIDSMFETEPIEP